MNSEKETLDITELDSKNLEKIVDFTSYLVNTVGKRGIFQREFDPSNQDIVLAYKKEINNIPLDYNQRNKKTKEFLIGRIVWDEEQGILVEMTDFSKSEEERRHFSVKEVCSYLKIPYNNVLKEISYTNLTKALEYFGENKTARDGSYNPKRIDIELTKRGITKSRTKAQELIEGGYVLCNGELVDKKSHLVSGIDNITIIDNETLKYVSRGGLKLEKAIEEFNIDFSNKKIMDVGSSTGGFTDCALQHGAKEVIAIDVGKNQMDRELRDNRKVKLYEGTHIKDVPLSFFEDVDYITIDVSFISLTKVYEKIAESRVNVEVISLIKPQFECGKKIATKYRGMILDKKVHKSVLEKVIKKINNLGFFVKNLTSSPVRGGDGNIEYISYFTNKSSHNSNIEIAETVNKAFNLPRE